MKTRNFHIISQLGGLIIGIGLVWFALQGLSLDRLLQTLTTISWGWVLASMGASLLSCWFRAARWRLQIQAIGHSSSSFHTFSAVMLGYLANLVLPRSGEVFRCSVLTKTEQVPFAKGVGTVVAERSVDVLTLGLVLLSVFLWEAETFQAYLLQRSAAQPHVFSLSSSLWWVGGFFLLAAAGLSLVLWLRPNWIQRAVAFGLSLWAGILSLGKLKRPGLFFFYTASIWFCYWLMTYAVFFALPGWQNAENLIYYAWILMGIGSLGMLVPTPGGMGPYHLAIVFGVVSLNLWPAPEGAVAAGQNFALLAHASKALILLLGGLASALLLWKPRLRHILFGRFTTLIIKCNNCLRFGERENLKRVGNSHPVQVFSDSKRL